MNRGVHRGDVWGLTTPHYISKIYGYQEVPTGAMLPPYLGKKEKM